MRTVLAGVTLLACWMSAVVGAQTALTNDILRPLMEQAVKAGGGNPEKALAALDKSVREAVGDIDTKPVRLMAGPTLGGGLFGPYVQYRIDFRDRVRKLDSTDELRLNPYVEILIEPSRVDDPDIEKVVVQRDGVVVEPIANTLAAKEFKNRMGASFQMHAGVLHYPVDAFAPGASVTILLVPSNGHRNYETRLDAKTLARFQ